ncbi:hypothetical protein ACFQHW_09940 [Lapidilactobacillus achengensis]|uniref:Transposase n=1 Tax=Lapidilactobacillus achengensis TaxID=2486000 RepID=A0ABW1UQA0_9LACO|nr:hypothetical protein [Lapidilactobacillus achengensis]
MWLSGEIILSDLSLRIRPDFETSRRACGLAQNDAHHVPVRNTRQHLQLSATTFCHRPKDLAKPYDAVSST